METNQRLTQLGIAPQIQRVCQEIAPLVETYSFNGVISQIEAGLLEVTMERAKNVTKASSILKMCRSTLAMKLIKFGISTRGR